MLCCDINAVVVLVVVVIVVFQAWHRQCQ